MMWRSLFWDLWLPKLGELLSLGLSQALSPVMCWEPSAPSQPWLWMLFWLCHLGPQLLLSIFIFPTPVHSSINASSPPFPSLVAMYFIHCGPLQFPLKSTSSLPLTSVGTRSGLSYSFSLFTHPQLSSIYSYAASLVFFNSLSNIINFIFFLIFLWPLYAL